MRNILEFMAWAMSHASPARIPAGSALCVPLEQVGSAGVWQYLLGTTGRLCTQSLLDSKYTQYYTGLGWSRKDYDAATAGWVKQGVTVCDCQGLEDYYSGADTNAKGNYANYCEDKGLISKINRAYVIGEAVFCGASTSSINHVGWIAGLAADGEALVLHERGLSHGCVVERMSDSGKDWRYRGLMSKRYDYGAQVQAQESAQPTATVLSVTSPLMRGEGIQKLQAALNSLGYSCGEADGICGSKTIAGVKAFVQAHQGV